MRVFYVSDNHLLLVRFDRSTGQMDYMNKVLEDWKTALPSIERKFFRGDGELSPISEEEAQKIFDQLKSMD